MRKLSVCNKGLYLRGLICSGDAALNQSYLLFRLFTATLLSLGVIWLTSVLLMGSPVVEFLAASGLSVLLVVGLVWPGRSGNCVLFDSGSGLMDKLNQYKNSVLGVAHEG